MKTRMTTAFIAAIGLASISTASLADTDQNDGDDSRKQAQSAEPLGGQSGMRGMGDRDEMKGMGDRDEMKGMGDRDEMKGMGERDAMKDMYRDRMKMMQSMMRMHAGMMQGMGGGMMQGMGAGDRMKDNQIRPMLENAKADVGAILTAYDASGDGMLDVDEYAQWYAAVVRQQIVDGFQHLDADGTGGVSAEELETAVKRAASAKPMQGKAGPGHPSDKKSK